MKPPFQSPFSSLTPGWKLFCEVLSVVCAGFVSFVTFGASFDQYFGIQSGHTIWASLVGIGIALWNYWETTAIGIGAGALAIRIAWRQVQRRLPAALRNSVADQSHDLQAWRAADQLDARRHAPFIETALLLHARIQQLTAFMLQERMAALGFIIPLHVAAAYLDHPECLPKPDLWKALCRALYLPADFYLTGKAYSDPASCVARIRYFHSLSLYVRTLDLALGNRQPNSLKSSARRTILRLLEKNIARSLRINGDNLQ